MNHVRALLDRARGWARRLKYEAYAVYLAMRDPRTPWYARALAFFVIAHTFSPIDLIPDFIPVLGYLDDLLITPLGLWLVLRCIPQQVMDDARRMAAHNPGGVERIGRVGMALTLLVWAVILAVVLSWGWRKLLRATLQP